MRRFPAVLAAALSLAVLAGCGGRTRPSAFSTDNLPKIKMMVGAIKAKKKDDVERVCKALNNASRSDSEEKAAFDKLKAMVDGGDWAGAQTYAEACLAASTN